MKALWYLLVLLTLGVPASHTAWEPSDQFLDWRDAPNGPYLYGADGVPRLQWHGELVDQPVTVAQWGLKGWDKGRLEQAVKAGDWLLAHQQPDGTWVYGFDFPRPDGQVLRAPWRSALAQANSMSLLVRLYKETREPRWLDAALHAYEPLRSAPMRSSVNSGLFFEEYPTVDPPQHVLNGAMFVAVGLRDLAPFSSEAATDAAALTDTIRENLTAWDTGHGAAYGLTDRHVDLNYVPVVCGLLADLHMQAPQGWQC